MHDPFSNAGHVEINGTDPIDLSALPIGGFTPMDGNLTLTAITFPSSVNGRAYTGDATFLATCTFLEGVFYPIPAIAITPASGKAIGWLQG